MKKKKRVLMTVGILMLILMGGFVFKSCSKGVKQATFQTTPVKRGNLENIVSSTGTLSAVETVEVGSQVSGIVEKMLVDFNDKVTKGQVLAILDKTLFEAAVKDAEAGVFRARAKADQGEAELKRNQPLVEKGHLSEMEFLVTKTNAETAKADLAIAEAALKRAKTNLGYTVIRSPISGTVIERTVDAGQTIAASFQAPKLFIIAEDLTRMQIEANVDESDIGQIKENQEARFEVQAYPDEKFTGKVRQIRLQPTTIQNVVNYTVVVDASNETGKLLPGMTATVDFLIDERHDVLLVPNTALNFKPNQEMLKKYGPQMKEKMQKMWAERRKDGSERHSMGFGGGTSATGFGGGNMMGMIGQGGNMPNNMGIVFYLDETGIPGAVTLQKGVTDGINTEVVRSPILKEGMEVITAYSTVDSSKTKKTNGVSFLPRPPAGGPAGPVGPH